MTHVNFIEEKHGVCPGDARALYCLVREYRPDSILEIGRRAGVSTWAMAQACVPPAVIHTVDKTPAETAEYADRLKARLENVPAGVSVTQFGMTSDQFFAHWKGGVSGVEEYNFAFIDGSHEEDQVYRDIQNAVMVLRRPKGVVILHDVVPDLKAFYEGHDVKPGPWKAATRYCREHGLDLQPLRRLPWTTVHGLNVTSLAAITVDGSPIRYAGQPHA